MRKFILLGFSIFWGLMARSQDFSNKGKEFWIGYGNHVRMFEAITPQNAAEKMQLYMTSDVNTTGVIEIAGINLTIPFTVTANQITTVDVPRSAALLDEGTYKLGIHVTALKPIVVYSFIYVNAISGATLCLPVSTLGKNYYSVNYTQVSNNSNSYSYFDVIATDTGTTSVEITPAQNTKGGHAAGVPYVVTLAQGDVYQALGALTSTNGPYTGVDLTGSQVRSISNGSTSCKKIAVFCGSGKISIGCAGAGTSDNLYQQMYPVSTWGKTYITVPSVNKSSPSNQTNFYRIFKSDPSATVNLNGIVLAAGSFINGQYYEFSSSQPNFIASDKPIIVAQYFTTSGCAGNPGQGDPEMIYLNPVEQTISSVTLNSMQPAANTNINEHHINVVLKNNPQAINSFKIDGTVSGSFQMLPSNNSYAYAQITVSSGAHTLTCDSGFNAIAYGFGNAESYGYSAGTNLKDLYQFVSIRNNYATVNFPAGCKNSPFTFSMTFPYQPLKITWLFKGLFPDTTVNTPVFDSTWIVNGRTLYRYKLNRNYSVPNIGIYPITILAVNSTSDGCSGEQQIDYDLQIYERPKAAFNSVQGQCLSEPLTLMDSTNGNGRSVVMWNWDLGDGNRSSVKNPSHIYPKAGSYTIVFSAITDIGCLSDTIKKTFVFADPPAAAFKVDSSACAKTSIRFINASTPAGGLAKWLWTFGDGAISTQSDPVHVYTATGIYNVTLDVENNTGCKATVTLPLQVNALPHASFSVPQICLNDPFAAFMDSSTAASPGSLSYRWNFGDPNADPAHPDSSVVKDPTHKYKAAGTYDVTLRVTSSEGCSDDTTRKFTVNGANPQAAFNIGPSANLCSDTDVVLTDASSVDFGSLTRLEIFWDYTGDPALKTLDANPVYGKSYHHRYPDFGTPATKTFTIRYVVYSGITCVNEVTKDIIVEASPSIQFDALPTVCEEAAAFFIPAPKELYGFQGSGVFTGPGISSDGMFNPKLARPGSHVIRYSFSALNGCTTYQDQIIRVNPTPLADAGPDRTVLSGGSIILQAQASANCTYVWSPIVAIDNPNVLTPKVAPAENTIYKLQVTSAEGCVATDNVAVTVLKDIKVPNAFSPNGDGINDTWHIPNLASYPGVTVEVYNRYGQLVFRSVGYDREWKGDYNGIPLPSATYYWIINPKNGRPQINGSVTIIR